MTVGEKAQMMSRDGKKKSQTYKQPRNKLKGKKEEGERKE
jgi:hypothetical protein